METPINTTVLIYADRLGRIWMGWAGHLFLYDHGRRRLFSSSDGLPEGSIFGIRQDSAGGLWIGGDGGLRRLAGDRFVALAASQGLAPLSVFGIDEDEQGYWSLATENGIARIARAELEHAAQDSTYRVRSQSFNSLDGLPAPPRQNGPLPIISHTADGLVWVATSDGIAYVDPKRIPRNDLPPQVRIEGAFADGRRMTGGDPSASHNTREIRIDYTGLSLTMPERVLFRYKLEGADAGWQEAGTRRQAYYGRLGAKHYRFRVIACNNDGVWNETGATWEFRIAPAFYQRLWFQLLCGLAVVLAAAAAYQIRIRQIAAALNARFDERLAERTRIARDFHDTLLQTIQGSKLVADDAMGMTDLPEMRQSMERLSAWLGRAIDEGRAALSSLRNSTTQRNDLADAFERAAAECASGVACHVNAEGSGREMHPIVRDEVFRIGFEAIRNSAQHSGCTRITVDLHYSGSLVLRVCDNGKGFDITAPSETTGHFGLVGMRERAQRIGGRLTIASSHASGTTVELIVPRNFAFRE